MTTSIDGTALVLEGGGMRAAYTSAVVVKLLGLGWEFPQVCGISAGSSLTANYISRDPERTRLSFTDFAADPRFGNLGTWLAGRGYFDAEYIYQRTAEPHQALPFDFATFRASRQAFRIGATRTSDGKQEWFTREDVATMDDLMVRVRASSTMPGFMPPVTINGVEYVDGALGEAGGIPIDGARLDGYDRFFVVCTRPRDYVKNDVKRPQTLRRLFRHRPAVAEAIITRPARYNATREMLRDLEADGKAYVFYPRVMPVTNKEKNVTKLRQAYALGMAQVNSELPQWRDFLGV
ncbi:patatin family protein [Cutibacterium sp. WCA-380-WT-3A]|uniref:Patatin family protein n=1 Tax=Cutibacterium porci TaxID=2605781 RepID=A0A7K0J449_9ACTN|nr:patatin family protein [Cutibacterium porci]MSS44707.1 patatin family protein [Cutibacterium porci]